MSSAPPLKAMVLAAGAGTRLRPLTYSTPKPMVPVANRPVLHHVLDNLRRHNIQDVVLNLHSHPGQVRDYCGDGSRWGLRIRYSMERKLLGTAGAVKKVADFFKDGPFLIMSGDGLSDADITKFYSFHRKSRSVASMVTKAVDEKFAYGVTLSDKKGRIKGFVEKPSWGQFFSNQVNTGIYIFEPEILSEIPKGFYDFGHQLWPKLFKKKRPIFSWEWKGYWCDVGNLVEYRKSQIAVLDREAKLEIPGKQRGGRVWIEPGAQIDRSAKIIGPCAIGAGARIGPRALVGPYSAVANGAKIGPGARVKNSILFAKAVVGARSFLDNCILDAASAVKSDSTVYNAVVLKAPK